MPSTNLTKLSEQQQKQRLELVIEGTRLGMWDWNPQTNEVAFNDIWAEMLGHSIDEIKPELAEWESRVHPDDLDAVYVDITAHMEGESDFYENIHRMKHKDGHWVYILDRGKIVERDKDGSPIRFTGTHTDITDQKMAEINALEAASAKTRFLTNMSHEIRTPLTGIMGMTDLMTHSQLDSEVAGYVQTIRDCADTLMNTLNDILDFSRMEQNKVQIVKKPFDLPAMLEQVTDLFKESAFTKELKFEIITRSLLPQLVTTDEHRLRQILHNLLSNAIKFTGQGGVKLMIDCQKSAEQGTVLHFTVSDTGIGIKNTDKIWDRFEQDNQMITADYGGTGLGLAIVNSLCRQLGGSITVKSELGKGSDFTFTIPVTLAQNVTKTKLDVSQYDYADAKVLVVEDNNINRFIIQKLLGHLAVKPDLAENGKEAVRLATEKSYDLIFMDLHMPVMSGIEAMAKLSETGVDQTTQIFALTADATSDVKVLCDQSGFKGVITKPYDIQDIIQVFAGLQEA